MPRKLPLEKTSQDKTQSKTRGTQTHSNSQRNLSNDLLLSFKYEKRTKETLLI